MLSSHLMSEVEELCNRVAIISRGRIIREGALADLLSTASGRYRLEVTDPERARKLCEAHGLAPEAGRPALFFSARPRRRSRGSRSRSARPRSGSRALARRGRLARTALPRAHRGEPRPGAPPVGAPVPAEVA